MSMWLSSHDSCGHCLERYFLFHACVLGLQGIGVVIALVGSGLATKCIKQ